MGREDKRVQIVVESIDTQISEVVPQELSVWTDEHVSTDSDVIQLTQQFWGTRGFKLSAFECQEAIKNMSDFFTILDEWQRQSEHTRNM